MYGWYNARRPPLEMYFSDGRRSYRYRGQQDQNLAHVFFGVIIVSRGHISSAVRPISGSLLIIHTVQGIMVEFLHN
jgi:hypothetical protein